MDNHWQANKCGSMWQSSAQPEVVVAPSPVSQVQSQESSRNPMNNASHYSYRHIVQEPCSSTRKMMNGPLFQPTSFNLYNSGLSVTGTSFFTLLSGPPPFSQYDSQQVLSSKPSNPASKVHVYNSSAVVGPTEHEASFGSPELSSQNIDNSYLKSKIDTCPVVPIRILASDGGNTTCLHDIVQARKVSDPSLVVAKAANYHTSHGIEQLNGFSSLKDAPISGPTPAQSGKLHSSSIPHQPSPLANGLPRVFCLYASGDLFLSNSGLLGVVCSCHGFPMSISKFSEHSGLRDVNPGDAIHMDSGETIAQWRKAYFCKFGIIIPEDQCGWHWPEGFSAAADLVKTSERVPNVSRSSDLSNSAGPPRAFVASKQLLNNMVFPNNHRPSQNLVNEIQRHELERNIHDNCKLSDGFTETSQSNSHNRAANEITEQPVSRCLPTSKLAGGTGNAFQSSPACLNPIYKTKIAFTSQKSLQDLGSLGKDSDKFNDSRDGDILEKNTVSSNIELRLGQPSQQSRTLGKSNVLGFNTPRVSRVGHPLELISSKPLIYNVDSNRITEESKQSVNCAAQAAKSSSIEGQNRLRFSNLGFGAYSTRMPLQPEQLKADVIAGPVSSMPFSHLESPKDKMQSKYSYSGVDDRHVMPKQQYVESQISKLDSVNFGCTDKSTKVKLSFRNMENYKLMDREEGLGHGAMQKHAADKMEVGCHVKFMGRPSSSFGFSKTSREQNSHVQILINIPINVTDSRLSFNHPKTIFPLEQGENVDHGFSRPVTSRPMSPRPPLISRAPSIVYSSVALNSSPNMTSTMSEEEAARVMSSHTPPSRQGMKHSNQDDVSSSCGFGKDQNALGNSSNGNLRSSKTLQAKSTEIRDGYKLASKSALPEHAAKSVHSGTTSGTGDGAEKSTLISVSRETSFQIRDIGVQRNLLCDPYQTGPPLPRIGISENILSSSGHGNCCQGTSCSYVPDKCICWVQRNSMNGNSNLEGNDLVGAFREPLEIRTSMLSASNLDKDCTLGDRCISSGKIGETTKPNLKKVEFNTFQWKDVPSKMSERCHVPCKDQKAKLLEHRIDVNDQTSDVARKCYDQPVQKVDCMKEQVMSNISSKCSAPAPTQASVKISNGDSCTDDAQNTGCAKNFAVDEGSGIQKSWSSDDAPDSGSNTGFDGFACTINSKNETQSKAISNRSTRSLIDELRVIDSLRLKKVHNQVRTGIPVHENTSSMRTFEKDFKGGKRKRETKFKILGTSFPASPVSSVSTGSSGQSSQSLEHLMMIAQPNQERSKNCTCSVGHGSKRRSTLPASSTACCTEDVHKLDRSTKDIMCKIPRRVSDDCLEVPEHSRAKKVKLNLDFSKTKHVWKQETPCKRITRPVVCGRYGLISNGDTSKPAKIFSLGKILKTAKRCAPAGNEILNKPPAKPWKKSITREGNRHSEGTEMVHSPQWEKDPDTSNMLDKGKERRNERSQHFPDSDLGTRSRRKSKEVRKRSLYELITEGNDSGFATISKNIASVPQDSLKNGGNSNNLHGVDDIYRSPEELTCKSTPDVDTFCHVCGSLNNDEMNCLLECNRCLVKVHQACYGISKVPRSYWYCRPCKENVTNMVCVLCGYEGGVMTRAVQSSNIVKSLLKAWNVTESQENPTMPSRVLKDRLNADASSGNQVDIDAHPNTFSAHIKASSSHYHMNDTMVLNSVTAGLFDSTVKQWVHMVCGLWTPGTRCPNVDTMSAFDVSGACCPKGNVVCSMCKRPGGCCIRCRVVDCAVHFHPWCAHRKGLLQSEVEGAENEKVGFYGRCELHATEDRSHKSNSQSIQVASLDEKETCARTEVCLLGPKYNSVLYRINLCLYCLCFLDLDQGYKGRKREGFRHDSLQSSGRTGGCLFRQEQVDAWNHINRLMSFKKRLQRMPQPVQDVEYDSRKEYARYKQSKGWKHLVVYKSGIHALGLYTSLFISQNAMVVEYVGEIVGLRVADRRESQYQSGKQLQYKSACYFFRIDKEHIIDATRKGGIARFVNHSCQPNCVAKVITVRGEKKVVFLAERDIYPGEEITYDYHFNNEDEEFLAAAAFVATFLILLWARLPNVYWVNAYWMSLTLSCEYGKAKNLTW
ncbi:uncharacterized protein LOC112518972 isoform X5 [Cynara cardunculus var. scolymus]|uniref:uncharacterized protein LOC112518972 isoform X5 n=1 Tax=Cynara cardunculus var. scolymus TaxID=59895 RepID=UPI000D6296D8|nr:uncharacterized protein LOC112518972 isoform X5 [Cynara cardunculus var. scolymus]